MNFLDLKDVFIFAGHPAPFSITVFDNKEGNGKPMFTFCTHKPQIHFADSFITLCIFTELLRANK